MTTDELRLWRERSDWLAPWTTSDSVQCIAAAVPAVTVEARTHRAGELGTALAQAVERVFEIPEMWLLLAALDNFALTSRSGALRARRRGLVELDEATEAGLDASQSIEFEISEEGKWGRLAAAISLTPAQWGSAIRLMIDVPAVGVVLRPGVDPNEILPRLGSQALAGEGASPLHARVYHLRNLFAAPECIGVLTATGVFDDPELIADYHYRTSALVGAR